MWNCGAECNHPGTEGTVVEWRWDTSLISSDGYIARNPQNKVIVASFRGSVDLGDWAESFTAELVPWPASVKGSLVAGGFLSGYAEASEKVTSQVANLAAKYPDHSLVATGHSLGGSRASFFVADMSIKHPELVQRLRLFTYGQAKGCNRVFANMMDGMGIPVFREVYKGDIAPHLPFTDPDYVHFGTEAWVNDQGITFCKSSDTSNCSERLPPIEYNIPDHTKYPGL
ncbi:alpha/beta-hydrolase [Martensiomyces pterosporus]|nr:alpha/beta-hydrolase [Martensiomyces pterosporus]